MAILTDGLLIGGSIEELPKRMHHQIVVFENAVSEVPTTSHSWSVDVSLNGAVVSKDLVLEDPFSEQHEKELQWYLERYASNDPLATGRGSLVAKRLEQYGQKMFSQLQLGDLSLTDTVDISVVGLAEYPRKDTGDTIHRLHWEILEEPALWPPHVVGVVVRRILASVSPLEPANVALYVENPVNGLSSSERRASFNVLLIVARNLATPANVHQDADPSVILDSLISIRDFLRASGSPVELNVEIVRPGTYAALNRHLSKAESVHGPGCFHLIHFDLHGKVKRSLQTGNRTSYLLFAKEPTPHDSESAPVNDLKPIPASVVGKLLKKYQIRLAVLNSCESAVENEGYDANLTRAFAENGVNNILAMSFRIMSTAAGSFIREFYQNLFLQKLKFSEAASVARKNLRFETQRPARFGLAVQLKDWIVPVAYTCNEDHQLEGLPISRAEPSTIVSDPIIGRGFDMLRIERQLMNAPSMFLHGIAGVGKSSLIKRLYLNWKNTVLVDSVVYVDATITRDLESLLSAIWLQLEDKRTYP